MIAPLEYAERRQRLMDRFADSNALLVFHGNKQVQRNVDTPYEFRQDSTLRYLTGIDLPGISVVLIPSENKYLLFAVPSNLKKEVWTGKKPSLQELKELYAADEIYPARKIAAVLGNYKSRLPLTLPGKERTGFTYPSKSLAQAIAYMRLVKSPAEVTEIESALELTAKIYDRLMRAAKAGVNERELQAIIEYFHRINGATYAFPPIVTTNGAVLHSENNQNILQDGKLLLVDIGAELNGSNSDITRTFPVTGRFTPEQRELYEIVLRAKREAIALIKPGVPYKEIHLRAAKVIAEGLLEFGVLKGSLDDVIKNEAHRIFFPHGVGHNLGQDTHDADDLFPITEQRKMALQPGNVYTIEPGIYFIEVLLDDPTKIAKHGAFVDFDKARALIKSVSGIRIEDDVLVTEDGHRILGPHIPEEVEELEAIVGKGSNSLV